MNPTDPKPLLPCPFCGKPPKSAQGSTNLMVFCPRHTDPMPLKAWNTRAPSAELGNLDNLQELIEAPFDFVCQTKLAPCDVSQAGKQERGTLEPSELVQSSGGFSSERTPRTDAEQYAVSDGPHTHVTAASFARQLETELTQAQAKAAAMRAALKNALRFGTNLPECDKKAGRKALAAERDAANALVDRLAGVLDKITKLSDSKMRDGDGAREIAESALAEVAKSLSPRTTENTKPQ